MSDENKEELNKMIEEGNSIGAEENQNAASYVY